MIETAIGQLKILIENDPLFAAVFLYYFYKQRRGRPLDKDLVLVYNIWHHIYILKVFKNPQIRYKGLLLRSIYDIGVLLLNSLTGKEIYSTKKSDPFGEGLTGQGFKFKGSFKLYKELSIFRGLWEKLR